ncbi:MAG: hypothetical protein M0Q93_06905 [Terrimicrobiaceae bacterium]|nr:hypothetical protein [Terrimicrobiaceae bacterium]
MSVYFKKMKSRGYQEYILSRLKIIGPPEFVRDCNNALEKLRSIDSELYAGLLLLNMTIFPKDEKLGYVEVSAGLYSVPHEYYVWKESGILAFFVYVYFLQTNQIVWLGMLTEIPLCTRATICNKSSAWLLKHGLDPDLRPTFLPSLGAMPSPSKKRQKGSGL